MANSGMIAPKVSFSSIVYTQIPSGSYFIGFDNDNLGKLSKIDNTGTIVVIEDQNSIPTVDLSAYDYTGLLPSEYFIAYDSNNLDKLSKIDYLGNITVIEQDPYIPVPPTEDIVYADLYDAIINETLSPGTIYRLTDYKSVNFLNGWTVANNNPTPVDPSFDPREVHVGDTEVLLLTAITTSQLSPIAYSETYKNDIIEYHAFTNKIGVDLEIYNGATLPDASVVSGFDIQWDGVNNYAYFDMPTGYPALLGHYFYIYAEFSGGSYYQDGAFEPLTPGEMHATYNYSAAYGLPVTPMSRIQVVNNGTRVVLLDLTQADVLNYDSNSLYVDCVEGLADAYGWIARRNATDVDISVPFDFRGRRYRRYEVDLSGYFTNLGINYYGITDVYLGYNTTGNYLDFGVFNNYGNDAYSIKWDGQGGPDAYWYNGYSDNNVFLGNTSLCNFHEYTTDNTFIGSVFRANFEDYTQQNIFNYIQDLDCNSSMYNNVFASYLLECIFDGYSAQNKFDYTYLCKFRGGLQNNTFNGYTSNNDLGSNFNGNTVAAGFGTNIIGENCAGNTFSNNFQSNTIASTFQNNNVIGNVYRNIFGFGVIGNTFNGVAYDNVFGNDISSNTFGTQMFENDFGDNIQNNNIGNNFQNNTIGDNFQTNTIGSDFKVNRIGDRFQANIVGSNCDKNTFGDNCTGNTIPNNFSTNVFGNWCSGNNITSGSCSNNRIGNYFSNNTASGLVFSENEIGNACTGNTFTGNTVYNKIGNFCTNNTGLQLYFCEIIAYFQSNTLSGNFQYNRITREITATNFTAATHVYQSYHCEIIRASDGNNYLRYFDGTNFQHTSITA